MKILIMEENKMEVTLPPVNSSKNKSTKSSNRGSNSGSKCCVPNCTSTSKQNPTLSFHSFPKQGDMIKNCSKVNQPVDRLHAWEKILKVEWTRPKQKVCSLHFKKDDYFLPDYPTKKRSLKKIAVPSCNLPESPKPKKKYARPKIGILRNKGKGKTSLINNEEKALPFECINIKIENAASIIKDLNCRPKTTNDMGVQVQEVMHEVGVQAKPATRDFWEQVNNYKKYPIGSIHHSLTTDAQLNTLTGIESFKLLNAMTRLAEKVTLQKRCSKVDFQDRIIMTYTKLKQNLSYAVMEIMFAKAYSAVYCTKIFFETVHALSIAFIEFIEKPENEKVKKKIHEGDGKPLSKLQLFDGKAKVFKILTEKMPKKFLPIMKDIYTVIYAVTDLSSQILEKDSLTNESVL